MSNDYLITQRENNQTNHLKKEGDRFSSFPFLSSHKKAIKERCYVFGCNITQHKAKIYDLKTLNTLGKQGITFLCVSKHNSSNMS